jgi:hypothetical protein
MCPDGRARRRDRVFDQADPMDVDPILSALQGTSVSQAVAESSWIFPTVESVHVAAITWSSAPSWWSTSG